MKLLAGVLLLSLLPPAPIVLKRVPKADEKTTFSMKALIDLGGKDDVRFTGSFVEKVKAVEGDQFTTAVESRISVDVLGVVRQSAMVASERVERLDGTIVTAAKVDPTLLFGVARVDRLRAFYFPKAAVEVGASWWHIMPKDDTVKSPPFASYLKLEAEEKVGTRDTWRASIDAHEVDDSYPARVKGMVWLDKSDGSLVRGQWTINDFSYSPTNPPIAARLELTRVELP